MGAVVPLLWLCRYNAATNLQQFEALLALTNLASVGDQVGRYLPLGRVSVVVTIIIHQQKQQQQQSSSSWRQVVVSRRGSHWCWTSIAINTAVITTLCHGP